MIAIPIILLYFRFYQKIVFMQNSNVYAVGVSEDVKMTRFYLASPSSFFGSNAETEENVEDIYSDE